MPPANQAVADFWSNPTFLGFAILIVGGVILFGLYKEWWVIGTQFRRVVEESAKKDVEIKRWQDMAISAMETADRVSAQAVEVGKGAVRIARSTRQKAPPDVG